MVIATSIPTHLWNGIHKLLTAHKWRVTYAYDNFDAGIDFDFMILEKDGKEILMGWTNWFEGELGCSMELMKEVEILANTQFTFGEPESLTPEVIAENRRRKKGKMWGRI